MPAHEHPASLQEEPAPRDETLRPQPGASSPGPPWAALDESDVDADGLAQFRRWLDEARWEDPENAEAMALATASEQGLPAVRMVLLKQVDERGLSFYTHHDSPKGRDLAVNPRAALLFHWPVLQRQVRLSGPVRQLGAEESSVYFAARPRGAQLGAWASQQSEVLAGRPALEQAVQRQQERFAGQDVPCPPSWGGYLLQPEVIELWQARADRLHDRLRYRRGANGSGWTLERLHP